MSVTSNKNFSEKEIDQLVIKQADDDSAWGKSIHVCRKMPVSPEKMPSYCGLFCHTCPIYLATREEDKEKQSGMRAKIAEQCNELYGLKYTAKDITDCDGCRSDGGRLFTGCQGCEIRMCARQKGLENCAHCPDYICGKLESFFANELRSNFL